MAVLATLTISGQTYSVYGLTADVLGDAKTYFKGRLGSSAFLDADSGDQKQALITAVRMIDRRPTYSGDKTVLSQALQWPRDSAKCDGVAVTDNTIPDDIALGEFEMALALLEDEAVQDVPSVGSNIKRVGAGPASVEFFLPTVGTGADFQFPTVVQELISCFFDGTLGVEPTVTGTDVCSEFDDETYDLTDGYP